MAIHWIKRNKKRCFPGAVNTYGGNDSYCFVLVFPYYWEEKLLQNHLGTSQQICAAMQNQNHHLLGEVVAATSPS